MSPEDEQYFENYLSMFLTPGWKQFVEEAKDLLESYQIEEIKDEIDLSFVKGQRSSLLNIVRFETGIKNAFDMDSENA